MSSEYKRFAKKVKRKVREVWPEAKDFTVFNIIKESRNLPPKGVIAWTMPGEHRDVYANVECFMEGDEIVDAALTFQEQPDNVYQFQKHQSTVYFDGRGLDDVLSEGKDVVETEFILSETKDTRGEQRQFSLMESLCPTKKEPVNDLSRRTVLEEVMRHGIQHRCDGGTNLEREFRLDIAGGSVRGGITIKQGEDGRFLFEDRHGASKGLNRQSLQLMLKNYKRNPRYFAWG